MKSHIDYQELIDELKDEVGAGSLNNDEIIQILRDKSPQKDGYRPIIDWYYNREAMAIELAPSDNDDKEDLKESMMLREQYQKDAADLEDISVEDCLAEMFQRTVKKENGKKKGANPFF